MAYHKFSRAVRLRQSPALEPTNEMLSGVILTGCVEFYSNARERVRSLFRNNLRKGQGSLSPELTTGGSRD
jgi:hypothetical protein